MHKISEFFALLKHMGQETFADLKFRFQKWKERNF